MENIASGLVAVLALLPASLRPFREAGGPVSWTFRMCLAAAVLGPAVHVALGLASGWHGGLALNLWITVAVSAAMFAVACLFYKEAWRIAPLLFGYLALLALGAFIEGSTVGQARTAYALDIWLLIHIALSVAAYGMATLAAVTGLAVVIKQRALKRKKGGRLASLLPAVAVADRLQVKSLVIAAILLGADILTGMATEYIHSGTVIQLEHKTLLSGLAFGIIILLLSLHNWAGLRGRSVANGFLVAYLLLTLGYPGVKFVSDILIG